jgi:tellurite resistance protein
LQVLILIARADGRFVKSEQNAILRYATERSSDLGIKVNDHSLSVLRDWIKVQDPSEPEARLAILALKHRPDVFEILWQVSYLIAEADGKVREEELHAIGEIKNAITEVLNGTV